MKKKTWDVSIKDNPNRVVMSENDEFYTTDTNAYLVFKLVDKVFNPTSAVLSLENRNDGSFKNETVNVVNGLIVWEMPQRYIEHFGNWQGQLIYEATKYGQPEFYTSATFSFVVKAHIGDKKKPSLVEIEDWEKFIREGTALIETWEDMEDLRQANESQRQQSELDRQAQEEARETADLLRDDKIAQMEAEKDAVIANATVDSEVILARGGKPTLQARLDETTTQLAQTAKGLYDVNLQKNAGQKPLVVFIDDDGSDQVWSRLKPIFEEKNVPITLSIIARETLGQDGTLTVEQLKELQDDLGWEIASHGTTNTRFTDYETDKGLYDELFNSKQRLESHGLKVDSLVYPGGVSDERVRRIAKQMYKCGVTTNLTGRVNTPPVQNMRLYRIGMGSYFDNTSSKYPVTNTDEYYKAMVDVAVENNGLLIFMTHVSNPEHTEIQNQYIANTIDYCKQLGVDIVTLRDAFKEFGNPVEIGDLSIDEPYTIVDAIGVTHENGKYSNEVMYVAPVAVYSASDPIDVFPKRKVTLAQCYNTATNTGSPEGGINGMLTVYRTVDSDLYNYRTYRTSSGSSRIYISKWTSSGWSDWLKIITENDITHHSLTTNTKKEADNPVEFPRGESMVLVTQFSIGNGILKTFKIDDGSPYNRQLFYRNNNTTYSRQFNGTDWGNWVQIQML